jgi:hypothetical protein
MVEADEEGLQVVSMPPRRSCFVAVPGAAGVDLDGFNATTAFLLHGAVLRAHGQAREGFNATTAFLLR